MSATSVNASPASSNTGFDTTPAYATVARAIARLHPNLDEPLRSPVEHLITALLLAGERGSTCLPVVGDAARAAMAARFALWTPLDTEAAATAANSALAWVVSEAASPLVGGDGAAAPLILDRGHIYTHRMHALESRLAAALAERVARGHVQVDFDVLGNALQTMLRRPPVLAVSSAEARPRRLNLSGSQQLAVLLAATSPLSLISGGPGTGKTSIVLTLLRVILEIGEHADSIALAAPTGKAAKRLASSLDEQLSRLGGIPPLERQLMRRVPRPVTLHRLLGYSPSAQKFTRNRTRPLAARWVIVDETSMVDLDVMTHLLSAVRDDARLILLGDADQLPPIAAGAVFRDLVPEYSTPPLALVDCIEGELDEEPASSSDAAPHALARCSVRLRKNFRMRREDPAGAEILKVAEAIRLGDVGFLTAVEGSGAAIARRTQARRVRFEGIELLTGTSQVTAEFLEQWLVERAYPMVELTDVAHTVFHLRDQELVGAARPLIDTWFHRLERRRVLSATRVGPTGTIALNAHIAAHLQRRLGLSSSSAFTPGAPVVVTRNDYRRQLFNGDMGVVLRVIVDDDDAVHDMAAFPRTDGSLALFHVESLRGEVELGHAITVHKSQGSEFHEVLLYLPVRTLPILTRELLYTGVTRCRRSVVVIGSDHILGEGVMTSEARFSGLARRIAAPEPPTVVEAALQSEPAEPDEHGASADGQDS